MGGELTEQGRHLAIPLSEMYSAIEQQLAQTAHVAQTWSHRFESIADLTTWTALSVLYPIEMRRRTVQDLLADSGSEELPAEPIRYLTKELCSLAR